MSEFINVKGTTKDGRKVKGVLELETQDTPRKNEIRSIRLNDGNECQKIDFGEYQLIYMTDRSLRWLFSNLLNYFIKADEDDTYVGIGDIGVATKLLTSMICKVPLVPIILLKTSEKSDTYTFNPKIMDIALSMIMEFYVDDGELCMRFGIYDSHTSLYKQADMIEWYIPRLLDQAIVPFYITGYNLDIYNALQRNDIRCVLHIQYIIDLIENFFDINEDGMGGGI